MHLVYLFSLTRGGAKSADQWKVRILKMAIIEVIASPGIWAKMETQRNSLCGSLEGRFILAVVVLVCGASQKWWHNYWLVVHLPSFVTCRAHRGRWGWAGGTNPWAGQSLWAFLSHINAVHFHMAQRATAALGNDYMLCRIHHLGEQEKVRQALLKCEYTLTNHFTG